MQMKRITPFLSTHDLPATVAFYTDVLGFRVAALHPPEQATFCILDCGPCSLTFDASLWPEPCKLTGQLHFDVDGVMELFERVRDHAEILWGPEVYGYGRREFSCRDPNGYALVFSEETVDPPTCRQ
jgi:catechol 2,3-dioxygenase-like lactoylglutathione lyase family enzyme